MSKNKQIIKKILDANFGRTNWSENALELIMLQLDQALKVERKRVLKKATEIFEDEVFGIISFESGSDPSDNYMDEVLTNWERQIKKI